MGKRIRCGKEGCSNKINKLFKDTFSCSDCNKVFCDIHRTALKTNLQNGHLCPSFEKDFIAWKKEQEEKNEKISPTKVEIV